MHCGMGGPVSGVNARTSLLDPVRDAHCRSTGDSDRMKILALELSTAQGSLAWIDDVSRTDAIGEHKFNASNLLTWPNDRKDSGPFFDNVQQVVRQFGLPERIIVGLGPGSYAGVRIAISTGIGLQAAAGRYSLQQ